MKNIFFILFVLSTTVSMAQMSFQDSSVQVISYWELGDKHEYTVSLQNLKYTETDTTSNETMTYDVEVSVIDSTENSYTVRWAYKNFTTDSQNPIIQKTMSVSEDIAVDIKLDELGTFQSVENWEEVRDYMASAFDSLKNELPKVPGVEKIFHQMKGVYTNRATIESAAIQDALQFHTFHGGRFILNEPATGQLKTPNNFYPDQPFDTEVSVTLEELDEENNRYVMRSFNEVDSEQLTETTYQYLSEMFKNLEQELPKREDFKAVKNMTETVSLIHNTGWVIESVLWKELVSDGQTSMEIRTILLK